MLAGAWGILWAMGLWDGVGNNRERRADSKHNLERNVAFEDLEFPLQELSD